MTPTEYLYGKAGYRDIFSTVYVSSMRVIMLQAILRTRCNGLLQVATPSCKITLGESMRAMLTLLGLMVRSWLKS